MNWINGQVYEGNWNKGQMDGVGKLIYDNGNLYDGEFKQGKRHGTGLFVWAENGSSYKGGWREGLMHGKGTNKNSRGEVRYVHFENGVLKTN